MASSAPHHREDERASSPGHLSMSMGTEQRSVALCSVVSLMFLKLKLVLRLFRVGLQSSRQRRQCSRACNRGTTESYKERWLLAGYLTFSAIGSQWAWRGARFVALSTPCSSRIPPLTLYRPPQQCRTCLVVTQLIRLHGNQRGM